MSQIALFDVPGLRPHPAKWSKPLIGALRSVLPRGIVVDPFGGVGSLGRLGPGWTVVTGDLEREWTEQGRSNRTALSCVWDATRLPFASSSLPCIATSPCLAQQHRILTDDLRWVPCGDLQVGDGVLAFDEHGPGRTAGGQVSRRRWRRGVVVRSEPKHVACVRVHLENGDSIVTTPEHPWLSNRYAHASVKAAWVPSSGLMSLFDPQVYLQVRPWSARGGYDAGWLAGLFDGEGSLSLGSHGSPKLQVCQVAGPVFDRAVRLMDQFGQKPNVIARARVEGRKQVMNAYVTGGFPGLLRALGELRPLRLLEVWRGLDVSTRTVQAEKVRVVSVEGAGSVDIQELETSTGTYIGEGYLMHNSYGNRMADSYAGAGNASDVTRNTYRLALGRPLTADSGAGMQWGEAYRTLHTSALREFARVLKPGGVLALNMKDHPKSGEIVAVTDWWLTTMTDRGFGLVDRIRVELKGDANTNRSRARGDMTVDHESILVMRLGRRWLGCELNREYEPLINARTAQTSLFGLAS